jgi:hypothetical protein
VKTRIVMSMVAATLAAACTDDPFQVRWEENPLEAVLYSLDREELNRPSAFHMRERARVVVEDPLTQGQWDFALDRDGGALVLLPPRALGVTSRAAIAAIPGVAFEEVREAPGDTLLYSTREPIALALGTVYVVRTHQQPGAFGQACFYYGKVEPLELDQEAGVLRFLYDVSPDCNNRSLVPPD